MNRRQTAYRQHLIILLLALLLAAPALAGVRATLDSTTVYEGDPVTLIIESDGQQKAEPDLTPLNKDFRVIGNSTSTQVSIINGRRSDSTTWTIQLEPRRRGKLEIPALSVGDERTAPLTVEVTDVPAQVPKQQAEHLFIEAEANTAGQTYVQQQIPYTVKLYYDNRVVDGELYAPEPEHAVVEQLGNDKRYSVMRNGRRYQVIERHYAISPEKSGELQIPPASFKGHMAASGNTRQGLRHDRFMERFLQNTPFANDPFFNSTPFAGPGAPVRARSQAITLRVQPRPATAGNQWLPAEKVILQDSWTAHPPEFRVGEPVSRTLTVQAQGLTGPQIPELTIAQPDNTRLYKETPSHESRTDGNRVFAISKQTITYLPEKAGELLVPPVKLTWWNTQTNRKQTATLPQWEFKVLPGVAGEQTARPDAAVKQPATDTESAPAQASSANNKPQNDSWWRRPWLIAVSILALAVPALLVLKRSRGSSSTTPATTTPKPEPDRRQIMHKLQQACENNDAPAAAHTLLELASLQWADQPPANLGSLAARMAHGQDIIRALDRALYAADGADWKGNELWTLVKQGLEEKMPTKARTDDALKPLYPEQA